MWTRRTTLADVVGRPRVDPAGGAVGHAPVADGLRPAAGVSVRRRGASRRRFSIAMLEAAARGRPRNCGRRGFRRSSRRSAGGQGSRIIGTHPLPPTIDEPRVPQQQLDRMGPLARDTNGPRCCPATGTRHRGRRRSIGWSASASAIRGGFGMHATWPSWAGSCACRSTTCSCHPTSRSTSAKSAPMSGPITSGPVEFSLLLPRRRFTAWTDRGRRHAANRASVSPRRRMRRSVPRRASRAPSDLRLRRNACATRFRGRGRSSGGGSSGRPPPA